MTSDLVGILWLGVLLIINAFFVAAEFAVIAARRSQIETRANAGSRAARTALWAMENATLMLATSQLGITVCSLLILNVSSPAIRALATVPLELTGWSTEVIDTISFIVALVIVSFLHIVLGEVVPKNVSFSVPDRAVLILAPPLVFIGTILRPIILALNAVANSVLRLFHVVPQTAVNSTYNLGEIATIVEQSQREGMLSDSSGALNAAFEFTEKRVSDVAIALDSIITLSEDVTPAEVEGAVAQHGFSRYILVDDNGEPSGYVHLKDVIDIEDDEFTEPVPPARIRKLISFFGGTELEAALAGMRGNGVHMARVFDDTGATQGVLFLEDIIEELVGEVHDATRRQR